MIRFYQFFRIAIVLSILPLLLFSVPFPSNYHLLWGVNFFILFSQSFFL
jgi:hypothetical protein